MDESCLKDLIEIISKFSTYRNNTQNELLVELKALEYVADNESVEKLKLIVNNFLSSEYLLLLISIIQLIHNRKLSIQLQFKADHVCKSMFEFSANFIFSATKLSTLLCNSQSNELNFLNNFNNDINEICDALTNPIVAIRETCLTCLTVLINENVKCFIFYLIKSVLLETIFLGDKKFKLEKNDQEKLK